jgi:hypothetical protein
MHRKIHPTPKSANICLERNQTKKEKWHSFDLHAKANMLHDVIVGKRLVKDVAEKYGRS